MISSQQANLHDDYLHVDEGTLRDLEIFGTGLSERGVIALIDHTHTHRGRARLHEMVRWPLRRLDAIRARQALVRYAGEIRMSLALRDIDEITQAVDSYLRSSYVILPRISGHARLVRWRYEESVDELLRGLRYVAKLRGLAEQLCEPLEAAPLALKQAHDLAAQLRTFVELPACRDLERRTLRSDDPVRLSKFDARVRGNSIVRQAVKNAIEAIYTLDALFALASASAQEGYNWPEFIDSEQPVFRAEGLFHPLVRQPVVNDLVLASPEHVVYLTGPNMAGKTTFMKSCATAILMAHIGMCVPARSLVLSVSDGLFVSLTTHDSVSAGQSLFLAEVRRIRQLANQLADGRRMFSIIDEPFRGTNILDATDATRAVVGELIEIPSAITLVASHIADVARALEGDHRVRLACFEADVHESTIGFSYLVHAGVSTQRLGFQLLLREGVLERFKEARYRAL
jgi:DNA mismatch repair protein MutS